MANAQLEGISDLLDANQNHKKTFFLSRIRSLLSKVFNLVSGGTVSSASILPAMTTDAQEVEIKFTVADSEVLTRRLAASGFRVITERTHEENTLYDLPGSPLRRRGAILRIRKYGDKWTVTYKDKKHKKGPSDSKPSRHKSRREIETQVHDGKVLAKILEAVGLRAVFSYEKYRSEWTDGSGCVVIDETPLGAFAEIEGQPEWIDKIATLLGIDESRYITASYMEIFMQWKKKTRRKASHMTFAECK